MYNNSNVSTLPWMEEPGRLRSMELRGVGHDWATSFAFYFHALEKEMATHSSILAWRIPGTGEPGGLLSMGSHRVGHDWSDLASASAASICTIYDKSFLGYTLLSLWFWFEFSYIEIFSCICWPSHIFFRESLSSLSIYKDIKHIIKHTKAWSNILSNTPLYIKNKTKQNLFCQIHEHLWNTHEYHLIFVKIYEVG